MKKSVGILSGLAVAIAVATTAGAWYTGKQLPAELDRAITQANQELKKTLAGTGLSMSIELDSLEQHFFTSTAHYRLKAKDLEAGEVEKLDFEFVMLDQIEHGPFPWSRVKAFKLMPVMAASNGSLEKGDFTAPWFAAAGGKVPVTVQSSVGYDGNVESDIRLAPVKLEQDGEKVLDFSGMQLLGRTDRQGKDTEFHANVDRLELNFADAQETPVKILLNGFKVGGKLSQTDHDMIYVGNIDLALADTQVTSGADQQVLVLKGLQQNNLYSAEGEAKDKLAGRLEYKVADISYAGRKVGSGEMVFTMKSIDIPAMQALLEWYQTKAPQVQQAAAEGQALPSFDMTPEEQAKVQGDLQKMLAGKPQLALEKLSFKTANGESHFSLAMDFASPTSFDLPPDQLGKQLVSSLHSKLSVSKPMVGDLATLQALLGGETDAQAIAQQSSQAGEMVGMMAVQSGMATVQGTDVISSLKYADGMVDFNGKKMTVEEFAMLISGHLAALQPQG
ncbi:YdgA family protein [Pseudomonas sp. zfem004]|uniref:YdgA family protein n=2 Tax=unclassified Pseudomonas TaxID=196821 RepID=UPI0029287E40|nr:YdgA family protein [Pseudomonas sp. zfem004]MDU9404876.1 YdgA family protein [Pseudomonas sp. zfem004]